MYLSTLQLDHAQPPDAFKVLHTFEGTVVLQTNVAGASPNGALVSSGGVIYGATGGGGDFGSGTIFKINADGTGLTTLYSFPASRVNGHGVVTNSVGAGPSSLILSGNTLFGITYAGGVNGFGTLFKINTDGTGFINFYTFATIIPTIYINTNSDGAYPEGIMLSGNTLYGTTSEGGTGGNGIVFRINTDGTDFTNLHSFTTTDTPGYTNNDGAGPNGGLVLSGETLYGTTAEGGHSASGTIFSVNTDGTGFTNLHNFTNRDGAGPEAGLTLSGNTLYGTAYWGGSSGSGTVFSLNTDGTDFTNLYNFGAYSHGTNDGGAYPEGSLILSGNTLYGVASSGGSSHSGTIFSIDTNGLGFSVLYNFSALLGGNPGTTIRGTNNDGAAPRAGLVLVGSTLYGTTPIGGPSGNGVVFGINTDGSGFTDLYSFTPTEADLVSSDGCYPTANLVSSGNRIFGTTATGGDMNNGTLFGVNTDGSSYTRLHSFTSSADGDQINDLVLSGDTLFGAAYVGGLSDSGTVFTIQTNGSNFAILYNFTFNGPAGEGPSSIILSSNTLYGVAGRGGSSHYGSVFRLNLDGSGFTNLYAFTATDTNGFNTDGANPNALSLAGHVLYGTAYGGGSFGEGTIFRINTDGSGFTNLHNFTPLEGNYPFTNADGVAPTGLIAFGDTLYGTTQAGGVSSSGIVFKILTDGSGFACLHDFSFLSNENYGTNNDGAAPNGVILSGNKLYGTTHYGGRWGYGTVFRISTSGLGFVDLYAFTNGSDGAYPYAPLTLSGNTVYGTASSGGSFGCGTVFSLGLPPAPPVLGMNLAGNQAILSWSTSATNYVLQTRADLTSGTWTNITTGIGTVGGNFVFTNLATGTAFFRLKLP